MEKLLNPYDKESMKMAMLKHEETFRYQVLFSCLFMICFSFAVILCLVFFFFFFMLD